VFEVGEGRELSEWCDDIISNCIFISWIDVELFECRQIKIPSFADEYVFT